MKIARVFPTRTSMTPDDADAYVGYPDLFTPHYDMAYISVCFTWDKWRAEELRREWSLMADEVKVGGPAYDDKGGLFESGLFTKKGVTITSRGCSNRCPFCFVWKREGSITELPIVEGNIIQDNNFTACSRSHIDKVFEMLKGQRQISFRGGLESARIDDYFVDKLRSVRVAEMWLAYDHDNADKPLNRAVNRLSKYFKRDKIRCYVLIGYKDDTIEKAEIRLRKAWDIGTKPFAMLYRDEQNSLHTKEWRQFQRKWARPAIYYYLMKSPMGA